MMRLLLLVFVVPALVLAMPDVDNGNPFKNAHKWIKKINSNPHSTWTAGHNFDPELPSVYLKSLLGLLDEKNGRQLPINRRHTDIPDSAIPKTFDARKKWRKCKSLHQIRDQGNCGSCWAVAASSAFTDRLCIATRGKFNGHLSAEELMDCCYYCGQGCNGGYTSEAWYYFQTSGLVTGGDFNSFEGCQPYSKQPCEHHTRGPRPQCPSLGDLTTPLCKQTCTNWNYTRSFDRDRKTVKSSFYIPADVKEIQKEIMINGPVAAGFLVHEDFLTYKKGVYEKHPSAARKGGHAVKVIGWGTEKGTPYWLVQNSWNYDWGDKGLFKIRRGNNECNFESSMTAGIVNPHV